MKRTISMSTSLLLTLSALVIPTAAHAATLTVSHVEGAEYSRLDDAINAASDDDTILLMPGHYADSARVMDKRLTIIGVGGPPKVVLRTLGVSGANADVSLRGVSMPSDADLTVEDGRLDALNIVIGGDDNLGGTCSIYVDGGELLLRHMQMKNVTAFMQLFSVSSGSLTIEDSVLANITTGWGLIWAGSSDITLERSRFVDISTTQIASAALLWQTFGNLTILDTEVSGGGSTDAYVGHMDASSVDSVEIGRSTFADGTGDLVGSVRLDADTVEIYDTVFTGNNAGSTGALFVSGEQVSLTDTDFLGNTSVGGTAHLDLATDTAQLVRVQFVGGTGNIAAMGSYVDGFWGSNLLFTANRGEMLMRHGGRGTMDLDFAVITGNSTAGGALIDGGENFNLMGSIVVANGAAATFAAPYAGNDSVWVSNSLLDNLDNDALLDGVELVDCITGVAPMFVAPERLDFRLLSGSPAIDAVPCEDLDLDGSVCDMGMYGGSLAWEAGE